MSLARLRAEGRDLLELVLLPGLAAVLPWRICFRVFRFLCRADFLYRETSREALAQASARGWVRCSEATWLQRYRLVLLIDHADYYLSLFRSDRWMRRHLQVSGSWPDPDRAAILCTFHWGAGMWALRHVAAHAIRAHAIAAPQVAEAFPGRKVRFLYSRARVRAVGVALRTAPIAPSHSPRQILRSLQRREQILAAIDVPADQVAASQSIDFLGFRAKVPRGLLRLACDSGVPIAVYLLGIRLSDGKRMLQVHQLAPQTNLDSLVTTVFSHLEAAVRDEPAAWHFWSVAPRFFEGASG
jgi:hypothetical protein